MTRETFGVGGGFVGVLKTKRALSAESLIDALWSPATYLSWALCCFCSSFMVRSNVLESEGAPARTGSLRWVPWRTPLPVHG